MSSNKNMKLSAWFDGLMESRGNEYWSRVEAMSEVPPGSHAILQRHGGAVVQSKTNPNQWDGFIFTDKLIGTYGTQQEAMKRAVCAAIMVDEELKHEASIAQPATENEDKEQEQEKQIEMVTMNNKEDKDNKQKAETVLATVEGDVPKVATGVPEVASVVIQQEPISQPPVQETLPPEQNPDENLHTGTDTAPPPPPAVPPTHTVEPLTSHTNDVQSTVTPTEQPPSTVAEEPQRQPGKDEPVEAPPAPTESSGVALASKEVTASTETDEVETSHQKAVSDPTTPQTTQTTPAHAIIAKSGMKFDMPPPEPPGEKQPQVSNDILKPGRFQKVGPLEEKLRSRYLNIRPHSSGPGGQGTTETGHSVYTSLVPNPLAASQMDTVVAPSKQSPLPDKQDTMVSKTTAKAGAASTIGPKPQIGKGISKVTHSTAKVSWKGLAPAPMMAIYPQPQKVTPVQTNPPQSSRPGDERGVSPAYKLAQRGPMSPEKSGDASTGKRKFGRIMTLPSAKKWTTGVTELSPTHAQASGQKRKSGESLEFREQPGKHGKEMTTDEMATEEAAKQDGVKVGALSEALTPGESQRKQPRLLLPSQTNSPVVHELLTPSKKPSPAQAPAAINATFGRFDLSSLRPVREKKPTSSAKVLPLIEVIEVLTRRVRVCFRGSVDVCRSLQLVKKEVTLACERYGRPSQINFGTFSLRHAKPGEPIAAYVFGDHAEDFKKGKKESHEMVLARFERVFEEDKKRGPMIAPDPGKGPDEFPNTLIPKPKIGKSSESKATAASRATRVNSEPVEMRDRMAVDPSLPPDIDDVESICVVCQKARSQVVFEPCLHAAVCLACAGSHCHRFCPVCRVTIKRRVEPRVARLVRPRIYSAYSFM